MAAEKRAGSRKRARAAVPKTPADRLKVDHDEKRRKRDTKLKEEAARREKNAAARAAAAQRELEAERKRRAKKARAAEAYLRQWKDNREAWKFSTVTQNWVLQHLFDRKALPKSVFADCALAYVASIRGRARERLQAEATKVVSEVEADGCSLADRVKRLEKKLLKLKTAAVPPAEGSGKKDEDKGDVEEKKGSDQGKAEPQAEVEADEEATKAEPAAKDAAAKPADTTEAQANVTQKIKALRSRYKRAKQVLEALSKAP